LGTKTVAQGEGKNQNIEKACYNRKNMWFLSYRKD